MTGEERAMEVLRLTTEKVKAMSTPDLVRVALNAARLRRFLDEMCAALQQQLELRDDK